MPEVDVLDRSRKTVGRVELPSDMFDAKVKKGLLHDVVRNFLANRRQGNASTKTRALVRGGGRKPYRQKGTGRARAGSNRSPLWKGGGTVFGPLKRDYSYSLPKKSKWSALGSALSAKLAAGQIMVIEELTLKEPRTRELLSVLNDLGLKNVLIVLAEYSGTVELASRNIPHVDIAVVGKLNTYDILAHEILLLTREAVERIKEVYLE